MFPVEEWMARQLGELSEQLASLPLEAVAERARLRAVFTALNEVDMGGDSEVSGPRRIVIDETGVEPYLDVSDRWRVVNVDFAEPDEHGGREITTTYADGTKSYAYQVPLHIPIE